MSVSASVFLNPLISNSTDSHPKAMAALLVNAVRAATVPRSLLVRSTFYSNMAFNHEPAKLREEWPKPIFNMAKMTELLDHDNLSMRQEMREFLRDPVFKPR